MCSLPGLLVSAATGNAGSIGGLAKHGAFGIGGLLASKVLGKKKKDKLSREDALYGSGG